MWPHFDIIWWIWIRICFHPWAKTFASKNLVAKNFSIFRFKTKLSLIHFNNAMVFVSLMLRKYISFSNWKRYGYWFVFFFVCVCMCEVSETVWNPLGNQNFVGKTLDQCKANSIIIRFLWKSSYKMINNKKQK